MHLRIAFELPTAGWTEINENWLVNAIDIVKKFWMKFPMHAKDTISPKDEAGPKTFKKEKKIKPVI